MTAFMYTTIWEIPEVDFLQVNRQCLLLRFIQAVQTSYGVIKIIDIETYFTRKKYAERSSPDKM